MKKYLWVSLIVVSAVFFGTLGMLHAEAVGALQAGVAAAVKGEASSRRCRARAVRSDSGSSAPSSRASSMDRAEAVSPMPVRAMA